MEMTCRVQNPAVFLQDRPQDTHWTGDYMGPPKRAERDDEEKTPFSAENRTPVIQLTGIHCAD
jgi:hypothetical protein